MRKIKELCRAEMLVRMYCTTQKMQGVYAHEKVCYTYHL